MHQGGSLFGECGVVMRPSVVNEIKVLSDGDYAKLRTNPDLFFIYPKVAYLRKMFKVFVDYFVPLLLLIMLL